MMLAGLWHGAAWRFIIWGGFHGTALVLERALERPGGKDEGRMTLRHAVAVLITFHVVCLGWILFRAESVGQAADVLVGLTNWSSPPRLVTPFLALLIALGMLVQFTPPDTLQRIDRIYHRLPDWAVGILAGAALVMITAIGGDRILPFIYFQF